MEGRKLNLYAPLPSIRRIPSMKTEHSDKKTTTITRPKLRLCPNNNNTEQETPVYVLPQDQSFDHLTEPASIPFVWEQIPGKPKDEMATLIQQSDLIESESEEDKEEEDQDQDQDQDQDLDSVSSSNGVSFFSVNCSTSDDDDVSSEDKESMDLMMSRFLPAAKAMAFTHQKHQSSSYNSSEQKKLQQTIHNKEALVIRQRSQEQEHFAVVQSLYDDLSTDDDDDDDDEDDFDDYDASDDNKIYPDVIVKKKACGFLPKLCAKSSFKILNPVPINRVNKMNSGEQTGLPDWSTRRLSGFISPYRTSCSDSGFLGTPENLKRLKNRGISKSQELYPTRARRDTTILRNYSNSGEIKTFRNSVSTPPRNQRTTTTKIHDSRFLAEEVIRRRNDNNRSGNLMKPSPEYTPISPPPLPETPSRPWLRRSLLPPVNPRPYGVVLGAKKKPNQEVLEIESTKWETIVKTSYVHNDHVRYSQELIVHPSSRQNNT